MKRTFYIERANLDWPVEASRSLEQTESIVLIFERYNWEQRTLLHDTFKGYQLKKIAGPLPKEYRESACNYWGNEWYEKLVCGGMIAYVQVVKERVRTSVGLVPRSQSDKVVQGNHEVHPTPMRFSNLELKRCSICGQELPKYVYFQKYYKTSKDPRQGYCKVCQKYYLRWWRGKQPGTGQTFKQYCESDPDWKFETQFRL